MAELLSPDPPNSQKQRVPIASRLQSPSSPFFLGSNDDKLERAQARAARAAAIRRKSVAVNAIPSLVDPDPCLGKQQILELFQNCIKLASENVRTFSFITLFGLNFVLGFSMFRVVVELILCYALICLAQKINQKNTWELNLIDHLTEIIKVEEENDMETNFQKVTLFILLIFCRI